MSTKVIGVVAAILLCTAVDADRVAAENNGTQRFKEFCETFAGRWNGDLTATPDASTGNTVETSKAHFEGGAMNDGRSYQGRFFDHDYTGVWLVYYDNASNEIRSIWVRSDGRNITETATKTADGWRIAGKGSDADGTPVLLDAIITRSNGGKTHTWDGTITEGSQPPIRIHNVWTRVHDPKIVN